MTGLMDTAVHILVDLLDEAFERVAWHGPTLRGSIRGVTAAGASWRPSPGRHNIWELTVHAAYWKYAVRRRITGEGRGAFAYRGSNWFPRPSSRDETAWKADVKLLVAEHRRLREVVARLKPRDLATKVQGRRQPLAYMVRGIAAHDLYHAGQIQLLKRLQAE
jgi:hypothetical protein